MASDEPQLGEILRTAREAAGWSLARMEQATGYSKPYLSKLETGGKGVKAWHIQAYDRAPVVMPCSDAHSSSWASVS